MGLMVLKLWWMGHDILSLVNIDVLLSGAKASRHYQDVEPGRRLTSEWMEIASLWSGWLQCFSSQQHIAPTRASSFEGGTLGAFCIPLFVAWSPSGR